MTVASVDACKDPHRNQSGEFHNDRIDGEAIARLCKYFFHNPIALGTQHVFHLHRLDDRERLPDFDVLTFGHLDRLDQTRHRTQQLLAGVRRHLDRHQMRGPRLAFGVDKRLHLDPVMGEQETIGERAHLDRDRLAIDGAEPHRFARAPRTHQNLNWALRAVRGDKADTDPAGFPTWQLRAHPRDTTTTPYLALDEDILGWRVAPSAQRAYNVVQVAYVDPVSGPGVVTVSDPRLNGDGSQGSAPFRRRKLRRNLGKLPLTGAQATAIANAWLATYSNPTEKFSEIIVGLYRRTCAAGIA